MKSLEKELQATQAVEGQEKRAKVVSLHYKTALQFT